MFWQNKYPKLKLNNCKVFLCLEYFLFGSLSLYTAPPGSKERISASIPNIAALVLCHHCTTVLLQSYKYLHQIFTSQSESHFSALFCYQEPLLSCLNLKTHIVSCLCHSQIPRKFKGKKKIWSAQISRFLLNLQLLLVNTIKGIPSLLFIRSS